MFASALPGMWSSLHALRMRHEQEGTAGLTGADGPPQASLGGAAAGFGTALAAHSRTSEEWKYERKATQMLWGP